MLLHPRLGDHLEQEVETCMSQRIKEFSVRLCLLMILEVTAINYHQYEYPIKSSTGKMKNRHDKVGKAKTTGPQHYTKNYRHLRIAGGGRSIFPKENTLW